MRIINIAIFFGLVLGVGIADAEARPIGVAQDVKNTVTGDANNTKRRIRKGGDVFQNELIKTGFFSRAELRFIDKTLLSLSARSTVRLDSFVYNPKTRSGKIVINTLKGAFRFVSGSAVKSAYSIKTPVATIGVRGTIIDGYTDGRRVGVYILRQGAMRVCAGQNCQNVNRPGDFVVVRDDGSITKPKKWQGSVRGVFFWTAFPVGSGHFFADTSDFDFLNNDSGGEGGDSGGYGNSGGSGSSQSESTYP